MVAGYETFRENFYNFEGQYVVIGGTACDLLMEHEEMTFRATKDIDIVLVVEALTADFVRKFWEYVKEAAYEHQNKSTGEVQFYRFTSPKSREYPYMLELFSRKPDLVVLEGDATLTPLPSNEEISSLSAILLDDAYYKLLIQGQMVVDGIPVLKPACLIPFKAKAWLDLRKRKEAGEAIDSKNIRKHKNDIFRLAQLLSVNTRQELSESVRKDMARFLAEMSGEHVDLKALGIRKLSREKILDMLYECFGIDKQ